MVRVVHHGPVGRIENRGLRHWFVLGVLAVGLDGCGDSAAPPAPPAPSGFTGSGGGFRVNSHGFSFANYANDGVRANLTPVELRRMFGDRVCASTAGGACELTPPAEQFMRRMNQAMGVGHCEGMAVLSQLFLVGRANPMDFGAATANLLTIDNNPALQRELAYWWVFQALKPTTTGRLTQSPAQLVSTLRASFLPRSNQAYTIALFKPDFTGGHAITPVSIRDVSATRADVVVYDNNYPNVERTIEVDTAANTWRYLAATDPSVTQSLYEGTATTRSLVLVPLPARLQTAVCSFCGNVPMTEGRPLLGAAATTMTTDEPPREISLQGQGDVQIRDGANRLLGTQASGIVNDIPGAEYIPLASVDPWGVELEPIYHVPAGSPLTITIDGSDLTTMSPTDILITGRGYSLGVWDILLDPMQRDTVLISPTGAGMRYTSAQGESATIVVGVETEGADYLFTVRTHGGAGGESIEAELDPARGVLWLGFDGPAGGMNTFEIEVVRTDAAGDQTFSHSGNVQPNGSDLLLHYATWAGDGMPMSLGIDQTGDGTEDMVVPLDDM